MKLLYLSVQTMKSEHSTWHRKISMWSAAKNRTRLQEATAPCPHKDVQNAWTKRLTNVHDRAGKTAQMCSLSSWKQAGNTPEIMNISREQRNWKNKPSHAKPADIIYHQSHRQQRKINQNHTNIPHTSFQHWLALLTSQYQNSSNKRTLFWWLP